MNTWKIASDLVLKEKMRYKWYDYSYIIKTMAENKGKMGRKYVKCNCAWVTLNLFKAIFVCVQIIFNKDTLLKLN